MKKYTKLIVFMLLASLTLTACKKEEKAGLADLVVEETKAEVVVEETKATYQDISALENDSANSSKLTTADLSEKYTSNIYERQTPLYNVHQGQVFTIHFNTKDKIDPYKAVTVHTDSKCETSSRVWVTPAAYRTSTGIDIVLSPMKLSDPTMAYSSERLGVIENDRIWGYAPMYYISINYDTESETTERLDKKIVIPFTTENNVLTPNLKAGIDTNGEFTLAWSPIDGAKSYKIYCCESQTNNSENHTIEENGYNYCEWKLLAEIPSTETKIYPLSRQYSDESKTYITAQNTDATKYDYVVTAVKNDEESNFSFSVSARDYIDQLPISISTNLSGKTADGTSKVAVLMGDNTEKYFPVDYTLVGDSYTYSIPGTVLTGTMPVGTAKDKEIKNSITPIGGVVEPDNQIAVNIPATDITTKYGKHTKYVDCMIYGLYNTDSYVAIDQAVEETLQKCRDSQKRNGGYLTEEDIAKIENLDSIDYNKYPDAVTDVTKLYVDGVEVALNRGMQVEEYLQKGCNIYYVQLYKDAKDKAIKLDSVVEEVKESELEESDSISESVDINSEDAEEISDTLEDLSQFQEDVEIPEIEEVEPQDIVDAGYTIIADSAEEAYLAYSLINHEEQILLNPMPALYDGEYLSDVLLKVIYQNPYICTIDSLSLQCVNGADIYLNVTYAKGKDAWKKQQDEIYSVSKQLEEQIKSNGTEPIQIINSLWDWLEAETSFDRETTDYFLTNGTVKPGTESAFDAHGVLCDKIGVGESYAKIINLILNNLGINSRVVTGYLGSTATVKHAWNVIDIDGDYYWLDATSNREATNIKKYLYMTTSKEAKLLGYIIDHDFETEGNIAEANSYECTNTKYDEYVNNGTSFTNIDDALAYIHNLTPTSKGLMEKDNVIYTTIRLEGVTEATLTDIISASNFKSKLQNEVLEGSQLENVILAPYGNYLIVITQF